MVEEDEKPSHDEVFKNALVDAFLVLRSLEEDWHGTKMRLNSLEKEIAKLRFKMISLSTLVEEEFSEDSDVGETLRQIKEMGMTDAVREVLKASDDSLNPTQVRDKLVRAGYELDRYSNPQSLIHTTLKRLEKMGEVLQGYDQAKDKYTGEYFWYPFDTFKPDPADLLKSSGKRGSKAKVARKKNVKKG